MFYARGAADNKAMAAIFVANMLRYKRERLAPQRDLVMALTCDEEIVPSKYDGVEYLLPHPAGRIHRRRAAHIGTRAGR